MVEPGKGVGTPDHPHRGFETVTYLIDGELEHRLGTRTSAPTQSPWPISKVVDGPG